jgi:hypothetical protein
MEGRRRRGWRKRRMERREAQEEGYGHWRSPGRDEKDKKGKATRFFMSLLCTVFPGVQGWREPTFW